MNPQWTPTWSGDFNYIDARGLEYSETTEEIRLETRRLLWEARSILERYKSNPEKFEQAKTEYWELSDAFNAAFEHDNSMSQQELEVLHDEVQDMRQIWESFQEAMADTIARNTDSLFVIFDDDIRDKNTILETLWNKAEFTDIKKEIESGWETVSALLMLQLSNIQAKNYTEMQNVINRTQEKYLYDLWIVNGYSPKYIQWYNNEIWNYVITHEDAEETFRNNPPETWNSHVLVNYFKFLDQWGMLSLNHLISAIWPGNLAVLWELWWNQTEWNFGIARNIISQNPEISWIISGVQNIDYSKLLDSPDKIKSSFRLFNSFSEDMKETILEGVHNYFTSFENRDAFEEAVGNINVRYTENKLLQSAIIRARSHYLGEAFKQEILKYYEDGPDIQDLISAIIDTAKEWNGEDFDFSGINEVIKEYNKENSKDFPLIQWGLLQYFQTKLSELFRHRNLSQNIQENYESMQEYFQKRAELRQQIKEAPTQEEKQPLQQELDTLRQNFQLQAQNSWNSMKQAQELEQSLQEASAYLQSYQEPSLVISTNSYTRKAVYQNPIQYIHRIRDIDELRYLFKHPKDEGGNNIFEGESAILLTDISPQVFSSIENIKTILSLFPGKIDIFPANISLQAFLPKTYEDTETYDDMIYHVIQQGWFQALQQKMNTNVSEGDNGLTYLHASLLRLMKRPSENENTLQWKATLVWNILNKTHTSNKDSFLALEENQDTSSWENTLKISSTLGYLGDPSVFEDEAVREKTTALIKSGVITTPLSLPVQAYQWQGKDDFIKAFLGQDNGVQKHFPFFPESVKNDPATLDIILGIYKKTKDFSTAKLSQEISRLGNYVQFSSYEQLLGFFNVFQKHFPDDVGKMQLSGKILTKMHVFIKSLSRQEHDKIREWEHRDLYIQILYRLRTIREVDGSISKMKERVSGTENTDSLKVALEQVEGMSEFEDAKREALIREILSKNQITDTARNLILEKFQTDKKALDFTKSINECIAKALDDSIDKTFTPTNSTLPHVKALESGIFVKIEWSDTWNISWKGVEEYITTLRKNKKYRDKASILEHFRQELKLSEADTIAVEEIYDAITQKQIAEIGISNAGAKNILTTESVEAYHIQLTQRIEDGGISLNYNSQGEIQVNIHDDIPLEWNPYQNNAAAHTAERSSPQYQKIDQGIYIFQTQDAFWNPIEIPINDEEKTMIEANEKAKENFISFYLCFQQAGLEKIWIFRENILTSLGNIDGFAVSKDEDYINSREANIVLSSILYTSTQNPQYQAPGDSLQITLNRLHQETHGAFGENQSPWFHSPWNKIELSFLDTFTFRESWDMYRFNQPAFEKALKWVF